MEGLHRCFLRFRESLDDRSFAKRKYNHMHISYDLDSKIEASHQVKKVGGRNGTVLGLYPVPFSQFVKLPFTTEGSVN